MALDMTAFHPKGADRVAKLRAAADFVDTIDPETFWMNHWWAKDGMAFDDWRNRMYRIAPRGCGCAIGHMIQAKRFGLRDVDLLVRGDNMMTPRNDRQAIFVRIGDAFGVPFGLAEFMFDQYAYVTREVRPADVSRRIRFVADELERMESNAKA